MIAVAMSRTWIALPALSAAAALSPPAAAASDQLLVEQYCTACHSDATPTAGVSLQGLDPSRPSLNPALWERALRKVSSGEMPPPGLPAPERSERAQFAARLERALDDAARASPNPGRAPARRLNRAEYSNAVRDLLHLDFDLTAMLPGDDSGYGFDNIADVLTLSPALLERYMFAARHVSRLAVGAAVAKPQRDIFVRNRETGFRTAGHAPASRLDLPIGSGRGTALKYYFPLTGGYSIAVGLDQGGSRRNYQEHENRLTVEAGLHTLSLAFLGESARAERTAPGGTAGPAQAHPPFDIRLDGKRVALVPMPATGQPFRIRSISIEGPFAPHGPGNTASRRKIFTCRPARAEQARPCAEKIVAKLARPAVYTQNQGARIF